MRTTVILSAFFLALVLAGCQTGPVTHNSEHGVTVTYPGNFALTTDPETLRKVRKIPESNPTLPFINLTSGLTGEVTYELFPTKPEKMTGQEHFDSIIMNSLKAAGLTIVEEPSTTVLDGKTFQTVGFIQPGDTAFRLRIYHFYHEESKRILIITWGSQEREWEGESIALQQIVDSTKVDWKS